MKDSKTGILIQARIGSTRLSGKVMMKIDGKTVMEIIIERLKRVKNVDEIILATSINSENQVLENEAERLGIECFRGDEENVLDRLYKCALEFDLDDIIRITGDCPLIDSEVIEKGIEIFQKEKADIVSNTEKRTYPHGFDFEIFTKRVLEKAWREESDRLGNDFLKVFVNPTEYIKKSGKFKHINVLNKKNSSCIRVTLDYPEDFKLIELVYKKLYLQNPNFGLFEIEGLFNENPELFEINKKYNDFIK